MGQLFDLTGKVAIITGSSRGIGAATARQFAKAGYRVALVARRAAPLEERVAELTRAGIEVAVISGRNSPAVERRMSELGVTYVRQGVNDKLCKLLFFVGALKQSAARSVTASSQSPAHSAMVLSNSRSFLFA